MSLLTTTVPMVLEGGTWQYTMQFALNGVGQSLSGASIEVRIADSVRAAQKKALSGTPEVTIRSEAVPADIGVVDFNISLVGLGNGVKTVDVVLINITTGKPWIVQRLSLTIQAIIT